MPDKPVFNVTFDQQGDDFVNGEVTFSIIGELPYSSSDRPEPMLSLGEQAAQGCVDAVKSLKGPAGFISDGYHTFDELYAHRIALFKALCKERNKDEHVNFAWKSEPVNGWFLAGIGWDKGSQITYHIPESEYDSWPAAVLYPGPEFDGHTSADVLKRLADL